MRRGVRITWTDEMLAQLAVMNAAEFAVQHGMSAASLPANNSGSLRPSNDHP